MKLKGLLLVLFVCAINVNAQDYFPKGDAFNGKYYSLNKISLIQKYEGPQKLRFR